MEISLRCSYRNKPSGFQNARFVCEDGKQILHDTSFTGAVAGIFTRQCGPMYFCTLLSDGEGKLVFIACGLGRRNIIESTSNWNCGDDTKIVNIIFKEENADDRKKIICLAYTFCKNYYRAGNAVLDSLIPTPDKPPLEYEVDYDKLMSGLDGLTEGEYIVIDELPAISNKLYLYFTPCILPDEKAQQVFEYYKELGLAVTKRNLLSVSCNAKVFAEALKSEDKGLKGLINKLKRIINQ